MTGFHNRMRQASKRELHLEAALQGRGWTVERWEPFPRGARDYFTSRRIDIPLRWWPDMFIYKDNCGALVDAKGVLAPNAAIEANAAWTYEMAGGLCPVLIFWQTPDGDWVGANADTIYEFTEHDPLPGTSRGSGTPWYRIPAEWCRPIDDVLDELVVRSNTHI